MSFEFSSNFCMKFANDLSHLLHDRMANVNCSISDMCEGCGTRFNVFKRKKICNSCGMEYCSKCFKRDDFVNPSQLNTFCYKCRVFHLRPLNRGLLMSLRVKELRWLMRKSQIAFVDCKEKTELTDRIMMAFSTSSSFPTQPATYSSPNTPIQPNTYNAEFGQTSENIIDESEVSSSSSFVIPFSNNATPSLNDASVSNSSSNGTLTSDWVVITPSTSEETNDASSPLNLNEQIEASASSSISVDNSKPNVVITEPVHAFSYPEREDKSAFFSASPLNKSTESLNNFKPFNIEDIKSEDDIRELSVRQLKLLLTRNYVNYKGVCEKEELQNKTIRLWKQVCEDRKVAQEGKDDELCKICMEEPINCVLLECGHYCSCIKCGKKLNECPMCRQYVVRALRIFKS